MWILRAKSSHHQLVPTMTLRICLKQKGLRIILRNSSATLTSQNHIKYKGPAEKCLPYHFWFRQTRWSSQGRCLQASRILRSIQATMISIAASIKFTNNFQLSEKTKIRRLSRKKNSQGTWIDKIKIKMSKIMTNQPKYWICKCPKNSKIRYRTTKYQPQFWSYRRPLRGLSIVTTNLTPELNSTKYPTSATKNQISKN